MAYTLTAPSSGNSAMRPKIRVWGSSQYDRNFPLENRPRWQEPRPKSRPTLTNFTPGIPQWPSRDPIGERGGVNLYGFVWNDATSNSDYLGRERQNSGPSANRMNTPYQPNNNRTLMDWPVSSPGNRPSSPNDPNTPSTDTPNAIVGAVLIGQSLMRAEADKHAVEQAVAECVKALSDSPCKGLACNSCLATYFRKFDMAGTPLVLEFAFVTPRSCINCAQKYPRGEHHMVGRFGPGLPKGAKIKVPGVGVLDPIWVDDDGNSFSVSSTCIDFFVAPGSSAK